MLLLVGTQFEATPFHYLGENSQLTLAMIQSLLRHQADPNVPNNVSRPLRTYLVVLELVG